MYPSKRKYKTKVQHVDSPRFNECFKVSRIPPEDVEQMGCRIRSDKRHMYWTDIRLNLYSEYKNTFFRLYGIGKVRDRLIGEAFLHFSDVQLLQQRQITGNFDLIPVFIKFRRTYEPGKPLKPRLLI